MASLIVTIIQLLGILITGYYTYLQKKNNGDMFNILFILCIANISLLVIRILKGVLL